MHTKLWLLALLFLALPAAGQPVVPVDGSIKVLGGYLFQTAITPESYVITNEEALKPFTSMLPPTTPYKNLPATPNPDPFLHGFKVDFDQQVLVVAVGRDRITKAPVFGGVQAAEDGTRLVLFSLQDTTGEAHPYGWSVYTAVVLPKTDGTTRAVVITVPKQSQPWLKDGKFPDAKFPSL